MTEFLTRVELHGAKHGDDSYKILHAEMAKKKFALTIPTSDRVRKLPTAEYYYQGGDKTEVKTVFDLAKEAANATKKTSEIITAKMNGFMTDCPVVAAVK